MSDVEEPPTKLSKIEDPPTPETLEGLGTEDESMMEDGQEEWLSEGVLTDDDFNTSVDHEKNDSNFGNISQISQDENPPINELIEQLDSSINTDQEEDDREVVQDTPDDEDKHDIQDKNDQETEVKLEAHNEETLDTRDDRQGVASKSGQQTIEETLNDFEGVKTAAVVKMDSFVISKSNGNVIQVKTGDEEVKSVKSEDDGNDTDYLLRMLGEGDNKTKKKMIKVSKEKDEQSTDYDDDEFIYEGAKVQTLKVSKYAMMKKYPPTRAEPENMSDGDDEKDASSDEADTMQKMFGMNQSKNKLSQTSTSKSSMSSQKKPILKHVVEVPVGKTIGGKIQQSNPKQYENKKIIKTKVTSSNQPSNIISQKRSDTSKYELRVLKSESRTLKSESNIPKSELNTRKSVSTSQKSEVNTKKSESNIRRSESSTQKSEPNTRKSESSTQKSRLNSQKSDNQMSKFDALKLEKSQMNEENEEIIDEEEFLEDDEDFDLDEDEFAEESDMEDQSKGKQRLMKPEMMDEEVPSDEESHSENGSLYDELPSSESEDMEDWFKLDIRAERAPDYLPFLGSKARELLLEEKRRVASRLLTLRQSLTALTDSAKIQADQIRDATMSLAELDDMLKAT